MSTVFLRRLSRWQAEGEREDVADLYVGATREVPGVRPLAREEFVRRFVDHDIQRPGFDMVMAGDPAPAGYAYGFRAERGSSWWDGFAEVPADLGELTRSRQILLVGGLVVTPARRRAGLATRMVRELLTRTDASLALTLAEPGNVAARSALVSWDWSKAGQLTQVDGAGPLEVWARRLGAG
ncbi:GNAT family N-acetyltransferase [Streptomyces sp. 4N509B]|uniref:GNAT family N-acetyltransferase n=1 Tax=Streptomyces sp. 4N509B TaxID=3457413 RepID=UPI003FD0EFE1